MPRLYHCTTAAGLKGIVEGRSVWASDYRFLNDSQEFRHGLALFREVLNGFNHGLERHRDGDIREQINSTIDRIFRNDLRGHEAISVFITSFSEAADLLSQWRGYNGGRGYSIGFDHHWIETSAERSGFILAPVLYKQDQQTSLFIARINLLLTLLLERSPGRDHDTMQQWYAMLFQSIACCKHGSFSEEQEYRMIRVQYGWPSRVRTRPAQGLIPYMDVPLDGERTPGSLNHPNNLGFEHVIVGPALDRKQLLAVDALLAIQHMRFEVTMSAIPFVTN